MEGERETELRIYSYIDSKFYKICKSKKKIKQSKLACLVEKLYILLQGSRTVPVSRRVPASID